MEAFEGLSIYSVWIGVILVWGLVAREFVSNFRLAKKSRKNLHKDSRVVASNQADLLTSGEPVLILKKVKLSPMRSFRNKVRKAVEETIIRVKRKYITIPYKYGLVLLKEMIKLSGLCFTKSVAAFKRFRVNSVFQIRKTNINIISNVKSLKASSLSSLALIMKRVNSRAFKLGNTLILKPLSFSLNRFKNIFYYTPKKAVVKANRKIKAMYLGLGSGLNLIYRNTAVRIRKIYLTPIVIFRSYLFPLISSFGSFIFKSLGVFLMLSFYPVKVLMDTVDLAFETLISKYKNENKDLFKPDSIESFLSSENQEIAFEQMQDSTEYRLSNHFIVEESLENFNVLSSTKNALSFNELNDFVEGLDRNKSFLVLCEMDQFFEQGPSINFDDENFNIQDLIIKNYSNSCDLLVNCQDLETALEVYNELSSFYSEFYFIRNENASTRKALIENSGSRQATV